MEALLPAMKPENAVELMAQLQSINHKLKRVGGKKTDDEMQFKLFSKLQAPCFQHIISTFDDTEDISFMDLCDKVRRTVNRIAATTKASGTTTSSESFGLPPSGNVMAFKAADGEGDSRSNKRVFVRRCWNCKIEGHEGSECKAAMCRNCKTVFISLQDPRYHHPTACPNRIDKRGQESDIKKTIPKG